MFSLLKVSWMVLSIHTLGPEDKTLMSLQEWLRFRQGQVFPYLSAKGDSMDEQPHFPEFLLVVFDKYHHIHLLKAKLYLKYQ